MLELSPFAADSCSLDAELMPKQSLASQSLKLADVEYYS